MLTGTVPTDDSKPPSEEAGVNSHLDEIVSKAMQYEPEDRFQQVSEIRTAIARMADKPASKKKEAPKRVRGRSQLAVAVLIAILIAIGIGGCKLW